MVVPFRAWSVQCATSAPGSHSGRDLGWGESSESPVLGGKGIGARQASFMDMCRLQVPLEHSDFEVSPTVSNRIRHIMSHPNLGDNLTASTGPTRLMSHGFSSEVLMEEPLL